MKTYTHCFFDLDGTLIDSAPGVTGCVRYALEKLGVPAAPDRDLTCFIGPTLHYGFSTFCELNEEDTDRAVALYREKYSAGGLFDCRVYDGIENTLRALKERGVVCVLATCKPHTYANRILAHLGLDKYISFVSGPELSGERNEKHEVIAYALEQLNICDPSSVLMVGDRASDVTGARENAVDAVGVLWGFGSEDELSAAGAVANLASPCELLNFFEA
ncbi:MAG: HAD hydrolase-like protein [Clostridia bacterium]|nr:HAD hydrolase-like protein [Clostridia bacterium]